MRPAPAAWPGTALGDGRRGQCRKLDAIGPRMLRGEGLERLRPVVHQPVAPALRAPEPRRVQARGIGPGVERGTDRLEVEPAHQLRDELLLADESAATVDAARKRNGVRELVGQAEAVDEIGRCVDQPVGQVLDGLGLALQFTFGGWRDATGQFAAAHSKILP